MQDHPKTPHRAVREQTIGVTAFKARCLELIDDVASGKLDRVVLTKRGKPVAEVTASGVAATKATGKRVADPWGHMKGQMQVDPTWDPTQPFEDVEWDAEKGILFNE